MRIVINDLQYWLVCSESGISVRELKVLIHRLFM